MFVIFNRHSNLIFRVLQIKCYSSISYCCRRLRSVRTGSNFEAIVLTLALQQYKVHKRLIINSHILFKVSSFTHCIGLFIQPIKC